MKNLKSIRDAADFSKENNKMFDHTPRRLFHELMSEDLTIKLLDYISDLEKCVEHMKEAMKSNLDKHICVEFDDPHEGLEESLATVEGILKKHLDNKTKEGK